MRRPFAVAVALAGVHCTLLAPTDAELRGRPGDGRGGADGGDAGDGDGGPPIDGAAADSWNDISTLAHWSKFDTTTVVTTAKSFAGGTFDGRYVYFVPSENGVVVRHDVQAPIDATDSWQAFDVRRLNDKAFAFRGAAFDGRYVYLAPHGERDGAIVTRYDTQGSFSDASGWSTFDLNAVGPDVEGFEGVVFDGRNLYFVPFESEFGSYAGLVARYDTKSTFNVASSWATFDTKSLENAANGYQGGVFDGKFVTFVPRDNGYSYAVVTRVDTTADFKAQSSWETFPVDRLQADAGTYSGGAFDGRYVYMAPTSTGNVLRYDTQGAFSTMWTIFPLSNAGVTGSFAGSAFDGRYAYFVPGNNTSLAVRVDSRAPFNTPTSWSSFDLKQVDPGATAFLGAVFDGQYLYFVPNKSARVLRFEAKPSRSVLHGTADAGPANQASFY